ncbi:MAG: LptF/LptG family permease [Deltaproteobacteria bacterium]|nr:LptF/LptG family permease [Candidatus Zymogenaceae bacterium]
MQSTISKYLLFEIITNFFVGIIIFSFVLLTGRTFQLADLIVNKGMSIYIIVKLFGMMLPFFLVFTIPMSLALAVILTFGRASYDYEIIALKSSGVSLYQLLRPVLIFSVFAWVLTSYLTIFVTPTSNFHLRKFIVTVLRTQINVGIEEKVFNDLAGRIIYVDRIPIRSNHLYGILVFDDTNVDRAITIIAQEGYLTSDEASQYLTISLSNGSILLSNKYTDSDQIIVFNNYSMNLNLFGEGGGKKVTKRNREMTLEELRTSVYGLRQNLAELEEEYERHPSSQNRLLVENVASDIRAKQVEISKIFAIPFACIVFMILGIPLSVQINPKGKSGNVVLVTLVIFTYYVFMAAGEVLGKNGWIPPLFSLWFGNVVLGGSGLYLFIKAAREKPVFITTLYSTISEYMTRIIARLSQ